MIEIHQVAYHRNGVSGNGFYAVEFTDTANGRMIASVFEERGNVAVFCVDKLKKYGIQFGPNSWRGDYYEPALREAIKEFSDADLHRVRNVKK